jgi:hypothetical protein
MNDDSLLTATPPDFYHDGLPDPDIMNEDDDNVAFYSNFSSIPRTLGRMLQQQHSPRGRTVLTVLYLCVLGICFVIPVLFYIRMHCDDRRNRRLIESEIAGIARAIDESEGHQREESRATRRKYREERRARILQLFSPVRMVRPLTVATSFFCSCKLSFVRF